MGKALLRRWRHPQKRCSHKCRCKRRRAGTVNAKPPWRGGPCVPHPFTQGDAFLVPAAYGIGLAMRLKASSADGSVRPART